MGEDDSSSHSGLSHVLSLVPHRDDTKGIAHTTSALNHRLLSQTESISTDDGSKLDALLRGWPSTRSSTKQLITPRKKTRKQQYTSTSTPPPLSQVNSGVDSEWDSLLLQQSLPTTLERVDSEVFSYSSANPKTFLTEVRDVVSEDRSWTSTKQSYLPHITPEDLLADLQSHDRHMVQELEDQTQPIPASIRDGFHRGRHLVRSRSIGLKEGECVKFDDKFLYTKFRGITYRVVSGLTVKKRIEEMIEEEMEDMLRNAETQKVISDNNRKIQLERRARFEEHKLLIARRRKIQSKSLSQKQVEAQKRRDELEVQRHIATFWDAHKTSIVARLSEREAEKEQKQWRKKFWVIVFDVVAHFRVFHRMYKLYKDAEKSDFLARQFVNELRDTRSLRIASEMHFFLMKKRSLGWKKLRLLLPVIKLWLFVKTRRHSAQIVYKMLSDHGMWFIVQMRNYKHKVITIQRAVRKMLTRQKTQICLLLLQFDQLENMMVKEEKEKAATGLLQAALGMFKKDKNNSNLSEPFRNAHLINQSPYSKHPSPTPSPQVSPRGYRSGSPQPSPRIKVAPLSPRRLNSPRIPFTAKSRHTEGMSITRSPHSTTTYVTSVSPTSAAMSASVQRSLQMRVTPAMRKRRIVDPLKYWKKPESPSNVRIARRSSTAFQTQQATAAKTREASSSLYPPKPPSYTAQYNPTHFKCPYFQLKLEVLTDDYHVRAAEFCKDLSKYYRETAAYNSKIRHFKQLRVKQDVRELVAKQNMSKPVKPSMNNIVTPLHMHKLVECAWAKRDELEAAWRRQAQLESVQIQYCENRFNQFVEEWLLQSHQLEKEFFASFSLF